MRNAVRLVDVLDRMENGPIVEEEEFDMNMIPDTISALQEKYDLYLPADGPIVPSDDALADRVFEAGLELAETVGVYCTDTGRRMTWSKKEILDGISIAPSSLEVGTFPDAHRQMKRWPEDFRPITIKGGPVGTPLPEHLFLPIQQSYAQEPLVDLMIDGSLETVYGREGRSRSPWEVLLSWHEMEFVKAAVQRAGRPGLGIGCTENSVSEIGELSVTAVDRLGPNHWHHVAMISEFKTNYGLMTKIAHLIKTGSIIHSFYNTIYGGAVGGREGVAIAIVGGCILLQMAYMTTTHSVSPTHPFYGNTTSPEILRGMAPAQQALSRNTHLLNDVVITPAGGPGTKTLLYEVAAQSLLAVGSGSAGLIGPRSGAGTEPGHVSGLEARFMAEVAHAGLGVSRTEINRIVMELVQRYENEIPNRPVGKRFDEVYDAVRVQPKPEWLDLYEGVKDELRSLGLDLNSAKASASKGDYLAITNGRRLENA
jgi:methylamine---corrinoid protein Co-methyltransferase